MVRYGGHYVPTASLRVIEGNERKEGVQINIKGMIEGNAWTNMPQDNEGALDTWVERAIAPRVLVDAVKQHCNLSYVGPLHKRDNGCNDAINAAMSAFDHVDIYDIYADVCIGTNPEMLLLKQMAKVSWFHARLFERIAARAALKNTKKRDVPLPPVDPCIDNHLSDYLNLIQVQRAINAVPQSARQPVAWSECSSVVQYDFSSVATSVVPVLEKLFARPDFHSLVLSGDVDAIVPVSGTLLWIESLNRTVIKPWHVWLDQDGQAGGFATVYDGFTFTTVRNAGHMASRCIGLCCSLSTDFYTGANVSACSLISGLLVVARKSHGLVKYSQLLAALAAECARPLVRPALRTEFLCPAAAAAAAAEQTSLLRRWCRRGRLRGDFGSSGRPDLGARVFEVLVLM